MAEGSGPPQFAVRCLQLLPSFDGLRVLYRAAFATLSLGGLLGALLKERPKPTFAGTLVHHASVRGGDRTTAVNQQRHRHGIELVFLSETSIVDHDWVVYLFLFNECLHWFPTFVHRTADNREPA